ncbi:hypothetical protein LOK49_LG05G03884 [Camellia lanceoleosa]|uniref:Uncharacterized protein n=1 Tax=Camellia lanceoleosa TaxID=1840588 RepID=A0ACC0HPM5_9ERIC|nr:hypothetical protein LOK49_LG05G03884 [Camellia lanceoleosa]
MDGETLKGCRVAWLQDCFFIFSVAPDLKPFICCVLDQVLLLHRLYLVESISASVDELSWRVAGTTTMIFSTVGRNTHKNLMRLINIVFS